jgi:hypothetical protein
MKHRRVQKLLRYGLDGLEIESRWWQEFPYSSSPVLKLTQPLIQWVPGLFPGGKVALTTHPI